MKTALAFVIVFLSTLSLASDNIVHHHGLTRTKAKTKTRINVSEQSDNGWLQALKGAASFTAYSNCQHPCKHCARFRGLVLCGAHAERDVLLQRAAYR
jgi:hypothetical protein